MIGIGLGSIVFIIALPACLLAGHTFQDSAFRSVAGFVVFYLVGFFFEKLLSKPEPKEIPKKESGSKIDFEIGAEFPGFDDFGGKY